MKNIIISIAAMFLFSVSASAQIEGRVTDAKGNGLSNVTVTATGEDGEVASTATTDEDGNYMFEDLDAGQYKITARGTTAFQPAVRLNINVAEDETTTLDITLVAAVRAAPVKPVSKPAQNNTSVKSVETPLTVDLILDKYVQAIGGKAAIQKLNSTFSKGTFEILAMSASGTVEMYAKAPNKRMGITTIPGFGVQSDGYDGATGWAQDPQMGVREKSGVELAEEKRGSDYYREIKLKNLYTKMELKGKAKVGDREAYVVVATPAEGAPDTYYFDVQNGLLVRMDQRLESAQGHVPSESYFEDYRNVDGMKVPFVVRRQNPVFGIVIRLDEVKHNVPIDDAKFAKPAQ